jgi:hypothetical protein
MFYKIREGTKSNTIRVSPLANYDVGGLLSNETPLIRNNIFRVKMGSKWYDIITFLDGVNFAISKKVKELLEEYKITGWSCFPIIIQGAEEKEYYAFQILSEAGRILNLETLNNYEEEFVKFDITTWNGTDFFTLEETGIAVCVPKVKELIEKAKITNIGFKPL